MTFQKNHLINYNKYALVLKKSQIMPKITNKQNEYSQSQVEFQSQIVQIWIRKNLTGYPVFGRSVTH